MDLQTYKPIRNLGKELALQNWLFYGYFDASHINLYFCNDFLSISYISDEMSRSA